MIRRETATESSYNQFPVVLVFKTFVSILAKNVGVVAAVNERERLAWSIASFAKSKEIIKTNSWLKT